MWRSSSRSCSRSVGARKDAVLQTTPHPNLINMEATIMKNEIPYKIYLSKGVWKYLQLDK